MTVVYIFRDPNNAGHSIEEVFLGIIKNLPVNINYKIFYYDQQKPLWRNLLFLLSLKADIYHITGDVNFLSLFLPRDKLIITFHDIGHYKNLKGWRKILYGWFWIRLPLSRCTVATSVSNYSFKDISKRFPSDCHKIKIIPNPSPPIFRYTPFKFNEIQPRILLVGTGVHKNLITTFAALENIPCKVVIIGHLNPDLHALLTHYQIDFENYLNLTQKEVYEQYKLCDLVSFVTTHEGFGMPVLEAQAVGRPLITSNVCSLPEVTNNSAAIIEDPMDTDALRAAFLKIINNPKYRKQLVTEGKENVSRYDIKKITQLYVDLYNLALH